MKSDNTVPTLPEDSIHPPQSSSPDPAEGLRELVKSDKTIEELEKQKQQAYWERNQLVAALSKLFPSKLARHPDDDSDWEDDWRNIVVIDLPPNATVYADSDKQPDDIQMTWHIHDHDLPMFDHLQYQEHWWDGHTTDEKYRRLRLLRTAFRKEYGGENE